MLRLASGSETYHIGVSASKYTSEILMSLGNLEMVSAQNDASCDVEQKRRRVHTALKPTFSWTKKCTLGIGP